MRETRLRQGSHTFIYLIPTQEGHYAGRRRRPGRAFGGQTRTTATTRTLRFPEAFAGELPTPTCEKDEEERALWPRVHVRKHIPQCTKRV